MASWPIKMWEMDLVVSPVRKFYLYQKDHPRAPNRGGEVGVGRSGWGGGGGGSPSQWLRLIEGLERILG